MDRQGIQFNSLLADLTSASAIPMSQTKTKRSCRLGSQAKRSKYTRAATCTDSPHRIVFVVFVAILLLFVLGGAFSFCFVWLSFVLLGADVYEHNS